MNSSLIHFRPLMIVSLNLEENIGALITFDDRINKLQHKLESLEYHMNECSTYEKKYEDKYRDKYVNSIVDLEQVDPVFVYETESFLFQTSIFIGHTYWDHNRIPLHIFFGFRAANSWRFSRC